MGLEGDFLFATTTYDNFSTFLLVGETFFGVSTFKGDPLLLLLLFYFVASLALFSLAFGDYFCFSFWGAEFFLVFGDALYLVFGDTFFYMFLDFGDIFGETFGDALIIAGFDLDVFFYTSAFYWDGELICFLLLVPPYDFFLVIVL